METGRRFCVESERGKIPPKSKKHKIEFGGILSLIFIELQQ